MALGIFARVISRKGRSLSMFCDLFSVCSVCVLLFSSATVCLLFLCGLITSPYTAQLRHSMDITLLHILQPYCSSKEDISGAIRKVPAPDPHTQIPDINYYKTYI